jgi:hypothetical protein
MARKSDTAKTAAMASELKAMFKALEDRPVPGSILSVVDQLDEGEVKPAPKTTRKRG